MRAGNGGLLWYGGGPKSTLTQHKLDGTILWKPSDSLFYGQHNPEILSSGDDTIDIVMFDNGMTISQL